MDANHSSAFVNTRQRTRSPGRKLTELYKRERSLPLSLSSSQCHINKRKLTSSIITNNDKRESSVPPCNLLEFNSLSLNDHGSTEAKEGNETKYDKKCPSFYCDTNSVEASLLRGGEPNVGVDDDQLSQSSYQTYFTDNSRRSFQSDSVADDQFDIKSLKSEDVFSEESYQSSIFRTIKKRKIQSLVEDAQDFDSNPGDNFVSLNAGNATTNSLPNPKPNRVWKLLGAVCSKLAKVIKLLIIILLLYTGTFFFIFSYSVWTFRSDQQCRMQNNAPFPTTISQSLNQCLVGHDLTIPVITSVLNSFNNDEDHLQLMWWAGQVGIGKSKASNILLNAIGEKISAQTVISSLLPFEFGEMMKEAQKLVDNMDICKPNLIVFDGFDEESSALLNFVKQFLSILQLQRKRGITIDEVKLKLLVIVIGTYGEQTIADAYLDHTFKNQRRELFSYSNLQVSMGKIFPFKQVSVNYTVIPFLPLDFGHLKYCVIQELNRFFNIDICMSNTNKRLEDAVKSNNLTVEYIYEHVLNAHSPDFRPLNLNNILKFGCKRVHQLVTNLLSKPI